MPPKKKEEIKDEQKLLWGRVGNGLKMGIVGLPNVGKSTTFNLLSKLNVPAENYPFCTIEPNMARVAVPDERFDHLVAQFKPKSKVQAVLTCVDIAGLVRGASKGEGLGNHFLSNINSTDGIFHVVRAFEDPEITHHELTVDPVRDMEIIAEELILKDLEFLERRIDDLKKIMNRSSNKNDKEEMELLLKVQEQLNQKKWVRCGTWSNKEIELLNQYLFLTSKPVIYLVNLSVEDYKRKKNKFLPKIAEWIKNNVPGQMIPYSAQFEQEFLASGVDPTTLKPEDPAPQVNKIIKQGFKLLDLIYFFTAGADEVKCWTIREQTKAPQAAGVIHTDFEKGFICADVTKYNDLVKYGTEKAVKDEGKQVQAGKQYVVEDGDIIFFKFNVSKGK